MFLLDGCVNLKLRQLHGKHSSSLLPILCLDAHRAFSILLPDVETLYLRGSLAIHACTQEMVVDAYFDRHHPLRVAPYLRTEFCAGALHLHSYLGTYVETLYFRGLVGIHARTQEVVAVSAGPAHHTHRVTADLRTGFGTCSVHLHRFLA